ncbi:Ribosomal RNA small subunit methyltransferase I [compost metagenome]
MGGWDGRFVFAGFLASKAAERQREVQLMGSDARACVLLEAPHRIEALAKDLGLLGERMLTVGRELTKQFEEVGHLKAQDFTAWLQANTNRTRGEFVLLVHPQPAMADAEGSVDAAALRTLDVLLKELPLKTAVKLCAEITGQPRNALYDAALARRQDGAGSDD